MGWMESTKVQKEIGQRTKVGIQQAAGVKLFNGVRAGSVRLQRQRPIGEMQGFQGLQAGQANNPFKPRFAMSRNVSHQQFGLVYQRDPETRALASGHFTGGAVGIYHQDTRRPGPDA